MGERPLRTYQHGWHTKPAQNISLLAMTMIQNINKTSPQKSIPLEGRMKATPTSRSC
jgi:hypothetical protein